MTDDQDETAAQAPSDDTTSAPEGVTVVTDTAVVAGPEVKRKDLIDRVTARSGLKRRDVKPAVEAVLDVLAEAIASGEDLNLPPLGKLKVARSKSLAKATVYHCRIRQPRPAAPDPLAKPAEEG